MRLAPAKAKTISSCLALFIGLLVTVCGGVRAEQLPLKVYTTADGLPRDYISRIIRDSHGFLWFCTPEGLSRFNGYDFVNYGIEHGLPSASVRDLLELADGTYLIATGKGVSLFNPAASLQIKANDERSIPHPKFVFLSPSDNERALSVNLLQQERAGVVWCATDAGLYRLELVQNKWTFSFVDIGLPTDNADSTSVWTILKDRRDDTLWIGTQAGLYRRFPEGRIERYTRQHGLAFNDVRALLEDRDGRIWVGTTLGLCQLVAEPNQQRPIVARVFTVRDGLAHNFITSLLLSGDGRLLAGTAGGLSEFMPTTSDNHHAFRSYTTAQGLTDKHITTLMEDRARNLWLGTESGGAMKMAHNGFVTYREEDGLSSGRIASIFENNAGELFVISGQGLIHRFEGRNFIVTKPGLPKRIKDPGWGWNQIAFQDRNREWWVPTSQGLCRFDKVSKLEDLADARPKAIYTTRDGLSGDQIFRLYEDTHGDIWIATLDNPQSTLTRWERSTETFHRFTTADGLPPHAPTVFREDRAGNLWIGFYAGGLSRYTSGRFKPFAGDDNIPSGMVRDIYLDQKGRLWVATNRGGLARIDDPTGERLNFVKYTTTEGLSSNQVTCITEDTSGLIYVGTGRGLDRLDSATGQIKHYTATDGLGNNFLNVSFRDHQGTLWFGTLQGLARLIPEPDHQPSPPSVLIAGLRVEGEAQPISDLGESALSGLVLGPNQNQLQIEFIGLSFGIGEIVHYQIKLEGADSDWGLPTENRAVNYAHLAPGTYRLLVRAIDADGITSVAPASVSFSVLPPIWRRWWFLTIAAALIGLVIYTAYRRRIGRLIELERVRTRIATDLHDDIGSSLSRMAILSEVVKQDTGKMRIESVERLTDIADTARTLVDSMSDIVWSIDPRRDDVRSVILRVRQFAADVLEAKGVKWELLSTPELDRVKLSPEQRRHLFLIFKEALTNIARHADCANVSLMIRVNGHQLSAEISDDGSGLTPSSSPNAPENGHGGHGLENMRARATQIGGRLDINSTPSVGTLITLTIPLKQSHGISMLYSRWRK